MKIRSCFAALAATCVLTLSTAANADLSFGPGLQWLAGCASVNTVNNTSKWIWITIYDITQSVHLDWGWVQPGSNREWRSGNYSCAGVYHVRAEVKGASYETTAPDGPNIFDTRIQLTGESHVVYLHSNVVQIRGAGVVEGDTSFWWDTTRDVANPTPSATVDPAVLTVVNSTALPMRANANMVNVLPQPYPYQQPRSDMTLPCIPPGSQWSNAGWLPGHYTVSLSIVDSCSAQPAPHIDQQVTLKFGATTNMALRPSFGAGNAYPGTGMLVFENAAPHPVQFMVDGLPDESPCVAAGATSPEIKLPEGPRKITATSKTRCGDASTGIALAPITWNVARFAMQHLVFKYELAQQ